MVEPESELWVPVPQLWFVGQASRPVTSLGHYGGGEFSERGTPDEVFCAWSGCINKLN